MNQSDVPPDVARGPAGCAAVAAGSKAAASAAAQILTQGGNAVDAVLGGTLAAGVCEPVFTSLGGGGFLMIRQPDGQEMLIDFFAETPGRGRSGADQRPEFTPITVKFSGTNQVFHAGPGSVAVPGVLAGLLHTSARFGRAPLATVVAPAIELGNSGTVLEPVQAAVMELVREIMSATTACRDLITVDGHYAIAGDLIHNRALATFLDRIGRGEVTELTSAPFADPMLELMGHTAGHVTGPDLAEYRVTERKPLVTERAGAKIALNPPPAFGGAIVADAMSQLGTVDGSPESWVAVANALNSATEHHRNRARREAALQVSRGTTHISVVDTSGQVACITTSNGAGSGVVVPGTGIHLNNMLGEEDLNPGGFHALPPGIRMSSMMAPTIVETAQGVVTGLGSGGSERIRSALLLTLLRLVDLREPAHLAIGAPRLHPEPRQAQLEPGWDPALVEMLDREMPVNIWSAPNLFFGGVHAVSRMPDGSVLAVGDSRRGGVALVVGR